MSNIIQFEPFKNVKQWDEEYPKFLGNVEKMFGAKTDSEAMMKRLYYAMRYLSGVAKSFMIFSMLGIPVEEAEKGKKYIREWLNEIVEDLQ